MRNSKFRIYVWHWLCGTGDDDYVFPARHSLPLIRLQIHWTGDLQSSRGRHSSVTLVTNRHLLRRRYYSDRLKPPHHYRFHAAPCCEIPLPVHFRSPAPTNSTMLAAVWLDFHLVFSLA